MSWGPLFLVLGGLCLQHAQAGLHSLRYLFSFLSEPPQYSVVGYVDDVPIIAYTSESGRAGPRAPWMERITDEDPQYWEESAETFQEVKKKVKDTLRNQMEQENPSPGLHVFQAMLGCELREDGSVKWFEQYSYDGSNYTPNTDPSTDTEDRQNSEELIGCIKALKKLLEYGEESLRRRVTPKARISRRKSGDRTFLTGYAYGFYPRDIKMKWDQNGVEIPWESRDILPNPDGTYQVRMTVEVQEGDEETYILQVDHSSLSEIMEVVYEEKSLPKAAIIVGAIVGVALLAAIISVLYFRSKASEGRSDPAPKTGNAYAQVNTGDPAPTDSSSSQSSV